MAAADITVTQDGGQSNDRLHPYFLALIRWCLSCVWSAGNVVLHRLMIAPLPSIAGSPPRPQYKPRPAGRDHLHPEPLVECVVLHEPSNIDMDVIFVHGLYGSLSNTWRQGEWRSKYKSGPVKVPLRRSDCLSNKSNNLKNGLKEMNGEIYNIDIENRRNYEETEVFLEEKESFKDKYSDENRDIYNSIETDSINVESDNLNIENSCNYKETEIFLDKNENTYAETEIKMNGHVRTVLADEDIYVDKDFYVKTLLDQVEIIDNYETQAKFVRDLFDYENTKYCDGIDAKGNNEYLCKNEKYEVKQHECLCKVDDNRYCEVGCGCICDECYSPCWPRDWIRADYPNARVISINYTSDPHLWRPLWIKGSKRLRLHERAEQMTQQLLNLGVGQQPIIWVGHSKGGLFIKHIYCEAYEAYLTSNENQKEKLDDCKEKNIENENTIEENQNANLRVIIENNPKSIEEKCDIELNNNKEIHFKVRNNIVKEQLKNQNSSKIEVKSKNNLETEIAVANSLVKNGDVKKSTIIVDVENDLRSRSTLWTNSVGFMFYSVPHRGSPLADFKTPITARSIELMEICKDCSLVLSLQERWLLATRRRPSAAVRSLVETCRTLMSVLWLRIVSVDSADAGVGTLHGVSLDHREICKPSSRRCLLYTELMQLIRTALDQREQ